MAASQMSLREAAVATPLCDWSRWRVCLVEDQEDLVAQDQVQVQVVVSLLLMISSLSFFLKMCSSCMSLRSWERWFHCLTALQVKPLLQMSSLGLPVSIFLSSLIMSFSWICMGVLFPDQPSIVPPVPLTQPSP